MKLIKINEEHYVVVDNSEIDYGNEPYLLIKDDYETYIHKHKGDNKPTTEHYKITHSTEPLELLSENGLSGMGFSKVRPLNVFEVKELIGEVDVAEIAYLKKLGLSNQDKNWIGYGKGIDGVSKEKWKQIYNQALEDNKEKKYTEEDLLNAFREGTNAGALHERLCDYDNGDYKDAEQYSEQYEESFIQSLQPKTEWEVEMVDGKLKLK